MRITTVPLMSCITRKSLTHIHSTTHRHTTLFDLGDLKGLCTNHAQHAQTALTLGVDRLQQLVYMYSKMAMNMIGFMSERTRGEPSAMDVSANMARNTSHLKYKETW